MNTPHALLPLQRHPSIGAVSSIVPSVLSWLEAAEPAIRVTGLIIGVMIGIVTLMLKVNELRRSRAARDEMIPPPSDNGSDT